MKTEMKRQEQTQIGTALVRECEREEEEEGNGEQELDEEEQEGTEDLFHVVELLKLEEVK